MKILHVTDVHGDVDALGRAIDFGKEEGLDVVACTGDLLGNCLRGDEVENMNQTFGFIQGSVKTDGSVPFEEILSRLQSNPEVPKKLKEAASLYSTLERLFDARSGEVYREIDGVFGEFPNNVIVIPGNWDSPDFFDHFGSSKVHKYSTSINGVSFAGYGGDGMVPVALPPTRTIDFSDEALYDFLREEDPDVALTHAPPNGMVDGESRLGRFSVLAYILKEAPGLLLCGHAHNRGVYRGNGSTSTVVVNSGNLGAYNGSPMKGTFSVVELDDNKYVTGVEGFQIVDKQVKRVA